MLTFLGGMQQVMQPAKPNMQVLEQRFGRVESLDFRRCEQLRNRNLTALASSKKLKVRSICIGYLLAGAHVKPRITNKVSCRISRELWMSFINGTNMPQAQTFSIPVIVTAVGWLSLGRREDCLPRTPPRPLLSPAAPMDTYAKACQVERAHARCF